jgi:hypothetical protein
MRKIIQKERDGGGGVGERTEVANHNTVEYRQTKSLMVRNYYAGQHYDALVGSEHEKPGGSVTQMIRMFPSGVSEMCSLAVACGVTEFEKASRNGVDTLAASMSSMRHAAQRGVGIDFCASRYAKGPELERGNSPSGAQAIAKKVGDDMWMQEYLQKCQAGLSADLQSVQSSTASAGEMSQEAKDLIQSLKLAAQLTKEDLKKVQDINTMPAFDPDTTAGLGHNPSFFNSLATRRSGICLSLLLHFFSRRLDPAAERL